MISRNRKWRFLVDERSVEGIELWINKPVFLVSIQGWRTNLDKVGGLLDAEP
jgi:hypothetical protein